ncbi:MAG: N-acetyltransferase [Spirochaetales bacterium]|nr:N-acetyltransferase [Spirochaetales bacterium]
MKNIFIHPDAHVSADAEIGSGTKIWINSQIRENSIIGENCIISKDTYIDTEVRIGNRVKIQNGVSVYHGVTIEDDVFVGPNAVFTNDLVPRAFNEDWKVTPTLIMKGASIGANSTIVCGNTIGEYAMVGAGSLVNKDVPSYALVIGNPARLIGYVCICGQRLDENNVCSKCNIEIIVEGKNQ